MRGKKKKHKFKGCNQLKNTVHEKTQESKNFCHTFFNGYIPLICPCTTNGGSPCVRCAETLGKRCYIRNLADLCSYSLLDYIYSYKL